MSGARNTMPTPIIQPTVGRIVWFYGVPFDRERNKWGARNGDQPMSAQVCFVHGVDSVNVKVTDHEGEQFVVRACYLYQGDEDKAPNPQVMQHCRWMPYQKAQAEKSGTVTLP